MRFRRVDVRFRRRYLLILVFLMVLPLALIVISKVLLIAELNAYHLRHPLLRPTVGAEILEQAYTILPASESSRTDS
jgi:ABC-type glycerol-3-phosphate transport system permease component